jgi:hypothetical protein
VVAAYEFVVSSEQVFYRHAAYNYAEQRMKIFEIASRFSAGSNDPPQSSSGLRFASASPIESVLADRGSLQEFDNGKRWCWDANCLGKILSDPQLVHLI